MQDVKIENRQELLIKSHASENVDFKRARVFSCMNLATNHAQCRRHESGTNSSDAEGLQTCIVIKSS